MIQQDDKIYPVWEAMELSLPDPDRIEKLDVTAEHHILFVDARMAIDRYFTAVCETLIEQGESVHAKPV